MTTNRPKTVPHPGKHDITDALELFRWYQALPFRPTTSQELWENGFDYGEDESLGAKLEMCICSEDNPLYHVMGAYISVHVMYKDGRETYVTFVDDDYGTSEHEGHAGELEVQPPRLDGRARQSYAINIGSHLVFTISEEEQEAQRLHDQPEWDCIELPAPLAR